MLGLDLAYMQATFDHSSFSRSGGMIGTGQCTSGVLFHIKFHLDRWFGVGYRVTFADHKSQS